MGYERPYYVDINYHPLIYYVIFGVKDEELKISRERHFVEEVPEDITISMLTRESDDEYMEALLEGAIGSILQEDKPELYDQIMTSDTWALISGEVAQDADLSYMKNLIGIVQAFVETGAFCVLDLQTFGMYSAKEWTDAIFAPEFNACSHVKILVSEMEDKTFWLHTRGIRKFGRPDVGIEHVKEEDMKDAVDIMNKMIYYSSLGVFFDKSFKIRIQQGVSYILNPTFVNDFDNPDYNNAYFSIQWEECEKLVDNKD